MTQQNNQRGIALLITLLIMSVLLAVSGSLLNITLKQYQFASIGLASEMAFQAANAGLECMLFHDFDGYPATGKFNIDEVAPTIDCMGDSDSESGNISTGVPYTYQFDWGTPAVCSDITIYKFYDASVAQDMTSAMGRSSMCPPGVTCTIIRARGYNSACPAGGSSFAPRTIEREITQRY